MLVRFYRYYWQHIFSILVGIIVAGISLHYIDDAINSDVTISEPLKLRIEYDCNFAEILSSVPEITLIPLVEDNQIEARVQVSDYSSCNQAVVYSSAKPTDSYLEDISPTAPRRHKKILVEHSFTSLIRLPKIWVISRDIKQFGIGHYVFKIHNVLNKISRSEFSFTVDFIADPIFQSLKDRGITLDAPPELLVKVAPPSDYTLVHSIPQSFSIDASEYLGLYQFVIYPNESDFVVTFRSQIAQQKSERQIIIWSTLLGIGIGLVLDGTSPAELIEMPCVCRDLGRFRVSGLWQHLERGRR